MSSKRDRVMRAVAGVIKKGIEMRHLRTHRCHQRCCQCMGVNTEVGDMVEKSRITTVVYLEILTDIVDPVMGLWGNGRWFRWTR